MSVLLKELMADFGLLREDEDVEKQVKAQLERAAKMDEVDTVTFGLETDDGRLVKVYVKAEQANDFEKALAGKLGTVDSIEQALNELSKDFEIVAVDWPEESEQGDDAESDEDKEPEDEESTDQAEKPEGEDVLNQQVYYNRKERDAQGEAPMSNESYKEKVRAKLLSERDSKEAVGPRFGQSSKNVGGLDPYFSYPLQFQIYKAILELGVPDVALTKSAYRQQIIQGIRRHAAEVMHDGALRNRLAYFLSQEIHQDDMMKKASSVKESMLTEAALDDFEALLRDLLMLLDNTPDNKYAKMIMNSNYMTALLRGASGTASSAMSTMRSKMVQFQAAVNQALQLRDAETKKAAAAARAQPGKPVAEDIEADGQKFKSSDDLAKYALRKHGGDKKKAKRFLDLIDAKEKVNEAEEPTEWEITAESENLVIACDAMTINVDDEGQEKLVKALSNKTAVVIKDAESGNKYTFSPRGSSVRVKQTGSNSHCTMTSKDVNTLLSVAAKAGKKDDEVVEEARRHYHHAKKVKKVEQPDDEESTPETDDDETESEEKTVKVKVKVKKSETEDGETEDENGETEDEGSKKSKKKSKESVEECDTGKKKRMSFKDMK